MDNAKSLLPTVEIVILTSREAKKWLDHNVDNRKVNRRRVDHMKEQMLKGKYILSPDAIAFDQNGRMFNGQHRLIACMECGVSIPVIVLRNAQPESFMITDIGAKKLASHALDTLGHANASTTAALTRAVRIMLDSGGPADAVSVRHIPPNEIIETVEMYPEIPEIGMLAKTLTDKRDKLNTTGTIVGMAIWYAVVCGKGDEIKSFLKAVADGVGLESGSPALALRRRLLNKPRSHNWQTNREDMALILKAFKMHMAGKKIENLVWNVTESYPVLEGYTVKED